MASGRNWIVLDAMNSPPWQLGTKTHGNAVSLTTAGAAVVWLAAVGLDMIMFTVPVFRKMARDIHVFMSNVY